MSKESPILVRIFKEESELEVWKEDQSGRMALLKTYPICRWSGDLGPKIKEGDRQAPEGFYTITPSLMNPNSSYYLSINMGYPNAYDRSNNRTGAFLMIHGDCSSRGCYAMTDEQIAEIYALARESFFGGQSSFQIQAFPFRMTPQNMARHRNSPHIAFWKMLKTGYDHFEVTRQEPKVDVCDRRYVFNTETKGRYVSTAACPGHDDAGRRARRGAHQAAARRSAGRRPDPPRQPAGDAQLRRRRHAPDLRLRRELTPCRRRWRRPFAGSRRPPERSRPTSAPRRAANARWRRARPPKPRPAASPSRRYAPRPPRCSRRAVACSATCSRRAARQRQLVGRRHDGPHEKHGRTGLFDQFGEGGAGAEGEARGDEDRKDEADRQERPAGQADRERQHQSGRDPSEERSRRRRPRRASRWRPARPRSTARSRPCRPAASTTASAPGARSNFWARRTD